MPMTFTTSGTTGVRKTFVMSDELIAARVKARETAKGDAMNSITSLFCDMSIMTWAGFHAELWAKHKGIAFYNSGGGTMTSTLALFQSADIEGITANPQGLMNYATAADIVHRFRAILSTGGRLSPPQSSMIRARLGQDLVSSYGASEVGSISFATGDQIEAMPGCVGTPCPGVEVKFEDGVVWAKTPTMIDGYTDAALTAQYFVDGWFNTGDRGEMKDGLLVLGPRA